MVAIHGYYWLALLSLSVSVSIVGRWLTYGLDHRPLHEEASTLSFTAFTVGLHSRNRTWAEMAGEMVVSLWSSRYLGSRVDVVIGGNLSSYEAAVDGVSKDDVDLSHVQFVEYNLCYEDREYGCPRNFVDGVDQLRRLYVADQSPGRNLLYFELDMIFPRNIRESVMDALLHRGDFDIGYTFLQPPRVLNSGFILYRGVGERIWRWHDIIMKQLRL